MDHVFLSARIFIPAIWIGMIIAIDLLEAPLKFTAPGITIPLGLGIGRRVFTAMNIVEVLLAIALLIAVIATRDTSPLWGLVGGIIGLLVIKIAVIRPLLNARTEAVLAGTAAPGSSTHLFYIALDAVLFMTLIVYSVMQARVLVHPPA